MVCSFRLRARLFGSCLEAHKKTKERERIRALGFYFAARYCNSRLAQKSAANETIAASIIALWDRSGMGFSFLFSRYALYV